MKAKKKQPPKRSPARPKREMKPYKRREPSQALVVRAPGPKPWLLKTEEIAILKNAVCKNATDKELEFCLAVARRYQLDPFRKQIWFVPRRDRQAEQTDGQQGGKVWVPVVSIDGLCHIAGRDHKDYGSFSEAEYGPMITISYSRNGKGATTKMQVPEWARIEAYKKGRHARYSGESLVGRNLSKCGLFSARSANAAADARQVREGPGDSIGVSCDWWPVHRRGNAGAGRAAVHRERPLHRATGSSGRTAIPGPREGTAGHADAGAA